MKIFITHSYHRLFYHFIWATKSREGLITPSVEAVLYPYLLKKVQELEANLLAINGVEDHVHLLVQMEPKVPPSKFVKDIKGSSSHFLNHAANLKNEFKWQTGYSAFSIGQRELPLIRNYIQNQKEHHRQKSIVPDWEMSDIMPAEP